MTAWRWRYLAGKAFFNPIASLCFYLNVKAIFFRPGDNLAAINVWAIPVGHAVTATIFSFVIVKF
jgi:hypothetical protein